MTDTKLVLKETRKQRDRELLAKLIDDPIFEIILAMLAYEIAYQYETKINPRKDLKGRILVEPMPGIVDGVQTNIDIPIHPMAKKIMAFSGWLILAKQLAPYTPQLAGLAGEGIKATASTVTGLTTLGGNALKALL